MSTKIGGFGTGTVQVGSSRTVKRSSDASRSSSSSVPANAGGGDAHITDSARKLAELEQSVQAAPAVDNKRVDEVSARLQNGSYTINAERIADKLLQSEQDLSKLV